MTGLNLFQDGAIKAIDFSPWGGIDGFLSATGTSGGDHVMLRGLVPWLNKAVNMTGNAVAQLPYYFDDGSENIIDEERAWGGVRNPQSLILKIASSLCSGRAYVLAETTNRAIVSLRYLSPTTVQPIFNSNGEPTSFRRQINGKSEIIPLENMIYFWLPDDTIEIGEAQLTPMRNAILPAQLIAAMDQSLKQYGERGFIPPTLLSAKGMTNKSDVEKTERWWNAFLRGWTSTTAKVMNAETMTATTLGAGMDELRGSYLEITRQQIENIAAAFNIPLSLFLSNAANYATAGADRKTWYETGVFVSIYQTIEDTFSEQLFNKFGYDFEFDPDSIDAFQEDENAKAGSLSTLAGAFATNPEASIVAADVLGYELTEEQIAAIEALGTEEVAEPVDEMPVDMGQMDIPAPVIPTDEDNLIASEMMSWRKFAERPRKREFETKHIPSAMALRISAGLRSAKSQDEIQAVFDSASLDLPLLTLARAIEKAA